MQQFNEQTGGGNGFLVLAKRTLIAFYWVENSYFLSFLFEQTTPMAGHLLCDQISKLRVVGKGPKVLVGERFYVDFHLPERHEILLMLILILVNGLLLLFYYFYYYIIMVLYYYYYIIFFTIKVGRYPHFL